MVIGSHNSWSYLTPKKWWMKLIGFTAKCQAVNIWHQHSVYNTRCFDLRVRMTENCTPCITHGIIEFEYEPWQLKEDLEVLNSKANCWIRVNLDVRSKKALTDFQKNAFINFCKELEKSYPNISFFSGADLYTHNPLYNFKTPYPYMYEMYASVRPPRFIDDWCPWLYAKIWNSILVNVYTEREILMIDFVNIQK